MKVVLLLDQGWNHKESFIQTYKGYSSSIELLLFERRNDEEDTKKVMDMYFEKVCILSDI